MKTLNTIMVLAILALGIHAQADGLYDITFTDGGANVGSGQIDVENGFAISGYFDVTAGPATGSFNLAGGTTAYPNYLTSPNGAFLYNNAVYLTDNPQYPATNPFLDNYGLLFTDNTGDQINFWGNSDGSYSLYGDINGVQYDPQADGIATLTAVPEPSHLATLVLLLIPLGFFRFAPKSNFQ